MGCDMVVALGRATADGQTLFGHNSDRSNRFGPLLCRTPGREHSPGEKVQTQYLELPQVRQTLSVLGSRPDHWWGYSHALNDQGVVMGCVGLTTHLAGQGPGLTGGDLVRLALERCHSSRQAVDVVVDLVERQGLSASPDVPPEGGSDHGFLIADAVEAFAVETAGRHWVYQEIHEVRAVSNVCIIRQDWDRISPGLAAHAIAQGWWPGDGSKLDFAGTLSEAPTGQASGLRRWGRATYLLEQQNGHIDATFLRRVLSDHYEGTHFEVDPQLASPGPVPLCQHGNGPGGSLTAASWVSQLSADPCHLPVAWCAFGPPCRDVYFPFFLDGDLPLAFTGADVDGGFRLGERLARAGEALCNDAAGRERMRDCFGRLQAQFDREAENFAVEGAALKQSGQRLELRQQAASLMQRNLEQFEAVLGELETAVRKPGSSPHGVLAC
jgi:dipeptidase